MTASARGEDVEITIRLRRGRFVLDVDLRGNGIVWALAGENGSGKSTLLAAVAGLLPCETARIRLGDALLADTASSVAPPPHVRGVGYVPQGGGLVPNRSALDNVALALAFGPGRRPRAERRARAARALAAVGVAGRAQVEAARLSGGEAARVALARALLGRPRVLLLDEPLSAVDARGRLELRAWLARCVRSAGVPVLLATHDVRDAAALGARIALLEGGRLAAAGPLDALREGDHGPFAAEFFAPLAAEPPG